ncbi:MAG: asparagine--tRNA ligase [Oscillospiraceae bacterium]|jgi:asparaginyl-tRNA synthetase|nr:asparagine--tRNA ligase [Oscillospiraceae bacterium]
MKLTSIKEIFSSPDGFSGHTVEIGGWIRTVRDSKAFAFIQLNDGSTVKGLQIVMDAGTEGFEEARKLNVGSAIVARGEICLTPEAKQPLEMKAAGIVLEGSSTPEFPLQKKRHTLEYLRTIAHLRPRSNTFNAVFRVRSEAAFAIHDFFHGRGFVYVHTPIITGSDAEGAGQMFKVTTLEPDGAKRGADGKLSYQDDFFGKETSLTVSGQLEAETFALAFGKTYTFGPTFRAERSNTPRHAAEFWMIEPEIAFADLGDDMELAEAMVKHIIRHVLETCPDEMEFFNSFIDKGVLDRLNHILGSEFARMTYTEAVAALEKVKDRFEFPVFWGCDLQTEHERYLTEELVGRPVFVTDYPKEIKAFYMRLNDDKRTVAAMDLLVPGVGELIGGSQREERMEALLERIRELGLGEEDYWWYLDLRRYGGTRHCGFGLGFERMIMYLTGISNIRDVIPFPRTTGSAEF